MRERFILILQQRFIEKKTQGDKANNYSNPAIYSIDNEDDPRESNKFFFDNDIDEGMF